MSVRTDARYALLQSHLQFSVPLRMQTLDARGGPDEDDRLAAIAYSQVLAEHGDDLIFGGGDRSSAALVADLVKAIAVLAYAPGGVHLFGMHFQSAPPVYGRAEA
jgi:hypothetical protein